MKTRKLLLAILALFCFVQARADVEINETNFPDANFCKYLMSQPYGKDGVITAREISTISKIDVSSKFISDLKGIEHFTELTKLICSKNKLTSLDVSKNTKLKELECGKNQLTSLDVSKNTKLTYLSCYSNQLTSLDVSKNTVLTKMECINNQLTTLDVSMNTKLTELYCYNNQLTTLDVSKNTKLTTLNCYSNPLTSLDVSGCTALTTLYCYSNQLTSLDVSKNTKLTDLKCDDNQLTSLDVSKNTKLAELLCGGNQLTSLDVSKNTALKTLRCVSNLLLSLDVSKITALKSLSCGSNQLTALDLSKNMALTSLGCGSNQLTTLDVSKNTALESLSCNSNQLTTLNVTKNTKLTNLSCYSNQIKGEAMDALIESLPTVKTGYMYVINKENEGNVMTTTQVAAAKAKGWKPKYYIDVLSSKDYEGSEPSIDITINETNFLDANFRDWLMKQSYGEDGVITADEIAAISQINVSSKNISDLKGIEFFTALKELQCSSNQLTSLDLSKNTKLTSLSCFSNQIKGEAMDALVESLPTVKEGTMRVINNENEGNVMTTTQVAAAKTKGWRPKYFDGSGLKDYAGSDPAYDASGDAASIVKGDDFSGEVVIPENIEINGKILAVTSIGDGAFKNNTKITSVTLPESVTSIGDYAFEGCSNLTIIIIGKSVTHIGTRAFGNITPTSQTRGNNGLKISCYAESVPNTAADAFENTPISSATLLVNDNLVTAYKTTAPWSSFGTIMGFDEASGINGVLIENGGKAKIFSIDGKPLSRLQKGINIIRMDDGTTKKVVVQ